MARPADWEITIPLAAVSKRELGQSDDYYNIIHDAYTTQYCEALGVEPNERRKKLISRFAPIDQCDIEANWGDDSAVCAQLRILQAHIGKPPPSREAPAVPAPSPAEEIKEAAAEVSIEVQAAIAAARARAAGHVGTVSALPPDVPDAAAVAKRLAQEREARSNLEAGGGNAARRGVVGDAEDLKQEMQLQDGRVAGIADGALVEELERWRRRARGDDSREDTGPSLRQWGEAGMRELERLRDKFILPWATRRPDESMVPWQSPEYRTGMAVSVPSNHVEELSEPISATLEQIMDDVAEYTEARFPIELLTGRRDPWLFAAIRDSLSSPEAVRMVGLFAHLLYWVAFGHLRPPDRRLPQASQQSLILTLQELWSRISDPGKAHAQQQQQQHHPLFESQPPAQAPAPTEPSTELSRAAQAAGWEAFMDPETRAIWYYNSNTDEVAWTEPLLDEASIAKKGAVACGAGQHRSPDAGGSGDEAAGAVSCGEPWA
mmetsp:Transcript_23483/g.67973  ORF Transcript_23483/g.67973 Transcript_23483/m.67973 type:complete len:491 (-) Transcript_23483:217-1689(-)